MVAEAQLPDNLTKWRATAVGHTAEQQFGSGQASFISRLAFMARLAPPRFMVAEDRLEIPGLLNDATNKEQQVKGRFEATGLTLLGDTDFTGTVPAGGSLRKKLRFRTLQPVRPCCGETAAAARQRCPGVDLPGAVPIRQREQAASLRCAVGRHRHWLRFRFSTIGQRSITASFYTHRGGQPVSGTAVSCSPYRWLLEQFRVPCVPRASSQQMLSPRDGIYSPTLQANAQIVAVGLLRMLICSMQMVAGAGGKTTAPTRT